MVDVKDVTGESGWHGCPKGPDLKLEGAQGHPGVKGICGPFYDRMNREEFELTHKLYKLQNFILKQESEQTVSDYQLDLLTSQEYYMNNYAKILRARLRDIEESDSNE